MSKKHAVHSLPEIIPPTVLTIFGATGDLATFKLIPTLIHMDSKGLLPKSFKLVLVGRREFTPLSLLAIVAKRAEQKEYVAPSAIKKFLRRVEYFKGDFDSPESFAPLARLLEDRMIAGNRLGHICYNRLYYFATSPEYFAKIAHILKNSGLLIGCGEHERTIRILVEKPFGSDVKSAKALNNQLLKFFSEEQIFRIDHYLGKETVQNIMVVRFANDFLEPIWNNKFIDHIEISVLESLGAGERANFYDKIGALKDFVQNHILQMLALTLMDRPKSLSSHDIRDAKLHVLKSFVPFSKKNVPGNVLRGQYKEYAEELGRNSKTETFVALKVHLKGPRWKGVPVYIRTGKRLPHKLTEISVHFKKHMNTFFVPTSRNSNVVTFRIQPDERVTIQVNNKVPGFGMDLHKGNLDFGYKMNFSQEIPVAYERLLLDFIQGDQRLFIRSDEIEASWKFVDSVNKSWNIVPLVKYTAGSQGPKEAESFIERDGRTWWTR